MNNDLPIPQIEPREVDTTTMPVLDVRKHGGGEQIRGALRYDATKLLHEEPLALPLPHDGQIAIYGDDEDGASRVAAHLQAQGYTSVAVLRGGFAAYRDAGLPTEPLTQEQPIPGTDAGIPRG